MNMCRNCHEIMETDLACESCGTLAPQASSGGSALEQARETIVKLLQHNDSLRAAVDPLFADMDLDQTVESSYALLNHIDQILATAP